MAILKKLKKGLKKVAKAAVPVGAAILAAKALQKRKRNAAIDIGINAANADSGSDMGPERIVPTISYEAGSAADPMAEAAMEEDYNTNVVGRKKSKRNFADNFKGVSTRGFKSGGRVKGAGVAKRGLGRAFKGGRK
jgi:hypothetical protein